MSSRLHDPVWQAFEREPSIKKLPTAQQLERRARGIREMRQGLFVSVDEMKFSDPPPASRG